MTPQRRANVSISKHHKTIIAKCMIDMLPKKAPCTPATIRDLLKKSDIPMRTWISSDQIKGMINRLSKFYKKHGHKEGHWSILIDASEAAREYADQHCINLQKVENEWSSSISKPMIQKYHLGSVEFDNCQLCQVSIHAKIAAYINTFYFFFVFFFKVFDINVDMIFFLYIGSTATKKKMQRLLSKKKHAHTNGQTVHCTTNFP